MASHRKVYPYHDSLRDVLRTVDAPLYALRLVRHLEKSLKIGQTDVEILLYLATFNDVIAYDEIIDQIDHRSEETIKSLLQNLVKGGYLLKTPISDSRKFAYEPSSLTRMTIRSVSKDSL